MKQKVKYNFAIYFSLKWAKIAVPNELKALISKKGLNQKKCSQHFLK